MGGDVLIILCFLYVCSLHLTSLVSHFQYTSTLWSDRVRKFEKKFFAKYENIFLQNVSLNYIYLLVKFLFCLFFLFFCHV